MILYVENPKNNHKKKLLNKFSKVAGYKMHKNLCSLVSNSITKLY